MDLVGPETAQLDKNWTTGPKAKSLCPDREARTGQTGQNWTKPDENWTKLDKTGQNWTKTGQNWTKTGQTRFSEGRLRCLASGPQEKASRPTMVIRFFRNP